MDCAQQVRELLDRGDLTDSNIDLKCASIFETDAGPIMYEQETNLIHLPLVYTVVAI